MQLICPYCQAALSLPEQARHYRGSVVCPRCSNLISLAAAPTPGRDAAPPRPTRPVAAGIWVATALVVLLCIVAYLQPVAGVLTGVVLMTWSVASLARGLQSLTSLLFPDLKRPHIATSATLVFGSLLMSGSLGALIKQHWRATEPSGSADLLEVAANDLEHDLRSVADAAAAQVNAGSVKLRAEAGSNAAEYNQQLDDVQTRMARGQWPEALVALDALAPRAAAFKLLTPIPPEYQGVLARYETMRAQVVPIADAAAKLATVKSETARGERLTSGTRDGETWKYAHDLWRQQLELLALVEAADPAVRDRLADDLPELRRSITAKIKKSRRYVDPYERKQAALAALVALCGPAPTGCGGWDGCEGAEEAFKRVAHDPGSVDVEHCTEPELTKKYCWTSSCELSANNLFKAKTRAVHKFSFSRLGVLILR